MPLFRCAAQSARFWAVVFAAQGCAPSVADRVTQQPSSSSCVLRGEAVSESLRVESEGAPAFRIDVRNVPAEAVPTADRLVVRVQAPIAFEGRTDWRYADGYVSARVESPALRVERFVPLRLVGLVGPGTLRVATTDSSGIHLALACRELALGAPVGGETYQAPRAEPAGARTWSVPGVVPVYARDDASGEPFAWLGETYGEPWVQGAFVVGTEPITQSIRQFQATARGVVVTGYVDARGFRESEGGLGLSGSGGGGGGALPSAPSRVVRLPVGTPLYPSAESTEAWARTTVPLETTAYVVTGTSRLALARITQGTTASGSRARSEIDLYVRENAPGATGPFAPYRSVAWIDVPPEGE